MLTVYYHVDSKPDPDTGLTTIATTDKPYWDANHYQDDGSSPHYEAIVDAMEKCGAGEITESVFEVHPCKVQELIGQMRVLGFDMRTNPEFTRLMTQHE